ncbi:MAG: DUF512 domain-containing protein [Candidatus Marinimicrobia bacterium]|nr:DUF512 domain-containing protein [Candidatus Neomarinimicrobiota bacterium]
MIEIKQVLENSIAEDLGLEQGDKILSINGNPVEDFLDLHYYESEPLLVLIFQKDGQNYEIEIEKEQGRALGITPDKDDMTTCSNNCIFCFIKQNPPGMRRQIYVCDEDYRYSFLQGNFVTLTDARQEDLDRIARQKLSPLYISIHATDLEARKQLFQFEDYIPVLKKLEFLDQHNIEMHTQIVLVPGVNDGKILDKTIRDLYNFKNSIKSVAIVPVGLTKHRKRLPHIDPVDKELAEKVLEKEKKWQKEYRNNEGQNFVYIADEIYLLADEKLPEDEHYAEYYQIENGVGLSRKNVDAMLENIHKSDYSIQSPIRALMVSGVLGSKVLREYVLPELQKLQNLDVDILPIKNNFFGESVTVSGLLTGQDIIDQVADRASQYDAVFLPPRCINYNGVLLDDLTPDEIEEIIGTKVIIAGTNILENMSYVKN